MKTPIAVALYIAAMTGANLSVAAFGPAVTPVNAFLLIGLDLTMRDRLHDAWSGRGLVWKMGALIAVAAGLSYLLNPASGKIALASFVAFVAAGLVDWAVYAWLKPRGYMTSTNGSNVAGAAVDSILFPTLAFGAFMPQIVALQFFAKVFGGLLWAALLHPNGWRCGFGRHDDQAEILAYTTWTEGYALKCRACGREKEVWL